MLSQLAPYPVVQAALPSSGRHICGAYSDAVMIVYQAFSAEIADYVVAHRGFTGCPGYSETRMTWVKTNFMWMMYRCGWCRQASGRQPKSQAQPDPNQSRVLAISVPLAAFDALLARATCAEHLSSDASAGGAPNESKQAQLSDVRLQWDPDHNPVGGKITRRAIQLGFKGEAAAFFRSKIVDVTDVTESLVAAQWPELDKCFASVAASSAEEGVPQLTFSNIFMPVERVYAPRDPAVARHVMISTLSEEDPS